MINRFISNKTVGAWGPSLAGLFCFFLFIFPIQKSKVDCISQSKTFPLDTLHGYTQYQQMQTATYKVVNGSYLETSQTKHENKTNVLLTNAL